MKKKIYKYFVNLSLIIINLSVKIKSHKLCAFVIWLNMRKLKSIKSSSNNIRKILVFAKSGGTEDLTESFNYKKTNLIFFLLPRSFMKKIYSNFNFGRKHHKDYFTKLTRIKDIKKKNLYVNFLTLVFETLNSLIKLDGYISFNIFYFPEKYFEEVCVNLKSKYIIMHKESAFSASEQLKAISIYRKFNTKSLSDKISVYTENQKKILVKSKIAHKNQIVVNGTPRSDYAFRLRKIIPKGKIIVFYLIEYNRPSTGLLRLKKINWKKLYNQTLDYLLEFAKNNPDIKIILKGKIGVHKREQLNIVHLPQNCNFIEGGTGHLLLRNASVVIAFHSTVVFEAIASNRNLIIPNFNNENKIYKNILHNIENKKYYVNSKIEFNKKIKLYLNLEYNNKKLIKPDIKTLKFFVGNIDATGGVKMRKFLENTIK